MRVSKKKKRRRGSSGFRRTQLSTVEFGLLTRQIVAEFGGPTRHITTDKLECDKVDGGEKGGGQSSYRKRRMNACLLVMKGAKGRRCFSSKAERSLGRCRS